MTENEVRLNENKMWREWITVRGSEPIPLKDIDDRIDELQKLVNVDQRVMPKIAEVIESKKQKILSSLNEYLAETNPSEKHEQHLQIIADCEIQICNELLKEFDSNFSA